MDKQFWNKLLNMINSSRSEISKIKGEQAVGDKIVKELSLNENTTLATIIYGTAGLTINKCIRILGQGNAELQSICEINDIINVVPTKIKGFLIVAIYIFCGIYAMNVELILK